jgi:hypothetical protein
MDLIDLPLELFQAIVTETVWLVGFRPAVNLRLVSSTSFPWSVIDEANSVKSFLILKYSVPSMHFRHLIVLIDAYYQRPSNYQKKWIIR